MSGALLFREKHAETEPRVESNLALTTHALVAHLVCVRHAATKKEIDLAEVIRALREENDRLAQACALQQTAPVAICSLDENGVIQEANEATARLFGMKPALLVGSSLPLFARPEERQAFRARLVRCVRDGIPLERELTLHVGNRDPIALTVRGVGVDGTCRAALLEMSSARRSEERQQLIISAGNALASSFGYQETIAAVARLMVPVFADLCFVELLQDDRLVRSDVAIAEPAWRASAAHLKELAPDAAAPQFEVLRVGEALLARDCSLSAVLGSSDLGTDCARGRALPHEASSMILVPLRSGGRSIGVMTFIMADSRRRYDAEDLSFARGIGIKVAMAVDNGDLYRAAQEAVAAREELLSIVSHELRTPLQAIAMSAATLLDRPAGPDRRQGRRRIESIARGAECMARLVDDLLDFSGARGLSLQLGVHSVRALVEEAIEPFKAQATARRVHLRAAGDDAMAICDRERIQQVLANLIGNALKFTACDGTVHVAATARSNDVAFTVTDTGSGIADEDQPHIFDRFWRGTRSSGCGLGLYICKSVVELHRGTIAVASRVGEGTTFTFTLPTNG